MLSIVENTRRKQLQWVTAILDSKGWRPNRLALAGGFSQSTLSKFLNDPYGKAQLNSTIVEKIARAGGIPPYHTETTIPRGFAETEAEPYVVAPGDPLTTIIASIAHGRTGVDAWVMKSRALEHAGYLPGDILIVDMNGKPEDGDAVCVQLYDRAGQAETAFRIYEPPFLVAAGADPGLRRPVLIDNERALVRGVVLLSIRGKLH